MEKDEQRSENSHPLLAPDDSSSLLPHARSAVDTGSRCSLDSLDDGSRKGAAAASGPTSVIQDDDDADNAATRASLARAAVQLKWDCLRKVRQQQRPSLQGSSPQPRSSPEADAAAIFASPVPCAAARADEDAARRSPPLLPLYASEPSMPWGDDDARAGWGRTLGSQQLPQASQRQRQPKPRDPAAETSNSGAVWLDAPTVTDVTPLTHSRVHSSSLVEHAGATASVSAGLAGDEQQEGMSTMASSPALDDDDELLSASARRAPSASTASPLDGPLRASPPPLQQQQCAHPQPLECVAARTIQLVEGSRALSPSQPRLQPSCSRDVSRQAVPCTQKTRDGERARQALERHVVRPFLSADRSAAQWSPPSWNRRPYRTEDVLDFHETATGSEQDLLREQEEEEDDDDANSGGMLEGDVRCDAYLLCCCGCCLGCGHYERGPADSNGAGERVSLLRPRQGQPQGPSSANSTSGKRPGCVCWRALRRRVIKACRFLDVFRVTAPYNDHLPPVSRVYCLLHDAAAVLMLLSLTAIAVHEMTRVRQLHVVDGTACEGHEFRDVLRPDLSSSLCCFLINAAFEMWFALRAARYEKSGFLVAAGVVAALQVTRVGYFVVYVAPRYFSAATWVLSTPVKTSLAAGALFSMCATLLSWRVRAAFGWRSFSLGITQPGTLALRRRYMRLQTCLQLDGVVTLNAYLAIVFLCDSWEQQVVAAAVTAAVLLALTLLMPLLRVTRHWWPLGPCFVLLLCSLGYYTFMISSNFASFPTRPDRGGGRGGGEAEDSQSSGADRSSDDSGNYSGSTSMVSTSTIASVEAYLLGSSVELGLELSGVNGHCYSPQLLSCLSSKDVHVVTADAWELSPPAEKARPARSTPSTVDPLALNYPSLQPLEAVEDMWLEAAPVNKSSTYLPTHGSRENEFFELTGCNYASCYLPREAEFLHFIHGCCQDYGRCSRKDNYRAYGVALLLFLSLVAFVVRVTLGAVAWRRVAADDDRAIMAFVLSQQGGSHAGGRGGASLPRQQSTPSMTHSSPTFLPEVRRQLRWDRVTDDWAP